MAKTKSPLPKGKSPTALKRLNTEMESLEAKLLDYEQLVNLRQKIIVGSMSKDLYTFLNKNHSLESLFKGLPAPDQIPEGSVESLQDAQTHYVDQAIEGLISSIVKTIMKIWQAFCDWINDWIDTNRRLKFRLQRHLRKYNESARNYGGDPATYVKIKGMLYNYNKSWVPMYNAVLSMNDLLQKVPQNDPSSWYETNFDQLKKNLAVFGYTLRVQGTSWSGVIEETGMIHSKQETTLGNAGWSQTELKSILTKTISMLDEEEKSRGIFTSVRRAFDRVVGSGSDADLKDIAAFKRLLRMCKLTKTFAAAVARHVNDVCNLALEGA